MTGVQTCALPICFPSHDRRKEGFTKEHPDRIKNLSEDDKRFYGVDHGVKMQDPNGTWMWMPSVDEAERYLNKGTIPTAPFVTDTKDWTRLAVRNAIEDAVNQGHGNVAWTTGAQQAERYDLSKTIGEVHYSGTNLKAYDHDGNTVISQTGVRPEDLADYIGKEAAEKMMAQKPQGTLRSLSGLDLQVGGEGMKGYYDKIVPQTVEEYLRNAGCGAG